MSGFAGIHAVLYAFFDAGGRLDRGAMRAQVARVLADGVQGIAVLGLATEVQKLTEGEARQLIAWTAEDLGRQRPLSVTITGNSVAAQRAMVQVALDHGADWLILQPPVAGSYSAATYLDFFADVADGFDAAFAIQNAPQYLGRALLPDDVARLTARNPRFSQIKAETSATDLAALIARCGTGLSVLNGRGGLEMTDCLRAGASGFVLAPDVIDHAVRVWTFWQAGEQAQAEAAHAAILPAITFMMQSLEHLMCYGKRIFATRAGLTVHDRTPALSPTDFGLRQVAHWAAEADRLIAARAP